MPERIKPWARTKYLGFVDNWPLGRIYLGRDIFDWFDISDNWPSDTEHYEGRFFTIHFRGQKLLYIYPISLPGWTKREIMKAYSDARQTMKHLGIEDETSS